MVWDFGKVHEIILVLLFRSQEMAEISVKVLTFTNEETTIPFRAKVPFFSRNYPCRHSHAHPC